MAPVLTRGRGARVWDVDGNCFVEYGMGLRSVTLGHAYPAGDRGGRRALADGQQFHSPDRARTGGGRGFPGHGAVRGHGEIRQERLGRDNGGRSLARAATGRDLVATCDQPFYSVDDWFVGGLGMNAGVPESARAQTLRFRYNDIGSLAGLFADASRRDQLRDHGTGDRARPNPRPVSWRACARCATGTARCWSSTR